MSSPLWQPLLSLWQPCGGAGRDGGREARPRYLEREARPQDPPQAPELPWGVCWALWRDCCVERGAQPSDQQGLIP